MIKNEEVKDSFLHSVYKKIKSKTSQCGFVGWLIFHIAFLAIFYANSYISTLMIKSENYNYHSLGLLLSFLIVIEFILFTDLKTNMTFHGFLRAKINNDKSVFKKIENIKAIARGKIFGSEITQESLKWIVDAYYLFSAVKIILMIVAMDKVFIYLNQPSIFNLFKLVI